MQLAGSVILVTGGSSGIGLQTAVRLKEAGALVIITGRNAERLNRAAQQHGLTGYVCDSGNEQAVLGLFADIERQFGTLHALINNAAYGYFAPLTGTDTAQFEAMFRVNVTGAMLMGREAARLFIRNNYGNIINIASTAAVRGFDNGTAYAASKFALRGMTECWRGELRKHNIRVMLINPSEVQTGFVENSGRPARPFNETKLLADDIAHAIVAALTMEDRGFITELTVFATNPQG